jgi:hypothetical protein
MRIRIASFGRIRIRIFLEADPDPGLQNWHLINPFSVEKYCE